MADGREKFDGGAVIVLKHPDDPVPQPKIVTEDGRVLTPEEANELLEAEDISDLDDELPE